MNSTILKIRAIDSEKVLPPAEIDLVVPAVAPVHDAIGEYTVCLAKELSRRCHTRILTSRENKPDVVEGVEVEGCFSLAGPNRLAGLTRRLIETAADAVILQYNPFGWGRRGWTPDLVKVASNFKRARPNVRLGLMFHETYTMSPGWRAWAMRLYQRHQFYRLASLADVSFFSTEVWAINEKRRRPQATVIHAPVGSNLPKSQADPLITRKTLGIDADAFICGVFGGGHPSRLLTWIELAVNRIAKQHLQDRRVILLHVGDRVDWPNSLLVPVINTGRLPAHEAANAIAVMDLLINPFSDGMSTRRGSAIAALQHCVPVLSTRGRHTEALWESWVGEAVYFGQAGELDSWLKATEQAMSCVLVDPSYTKSAARALYETCFSWKIVADLIAGNLHRLVASAHRYDERGSG